MEAVAWRRDNDIHTCMRAPPLTHAGTAERDTPVTITNFAAVCPPRHCTNGTQDLSSAPRAAPSAPNAAMPLPSALPLAPPKPPNPAPLPPAALSVPNGEVALLAANDAKVVGALVATTSGACPPSSASRAAPASAAASAAASVASSAAGPAAGFAAALLPAAGGSSACAADVLGPRSACVLRWPAQTPGLIAWK